MSNFKKYVKELEQNFLEARESYKKIYDNYIYTKNRFDNGNDIRGNETDEAFRIRRIREETSFKDAERELKENRIWDKYKENAEMIAQKLGTELKNNNLVRPDDLDANALEIIKSGVLTAEELEQYTSMYLGNATMRRLIAQNMHKRLETEQKESERAILYRAIEKAENGLSTEQEAFKQIVEGSYVLSGAFVVSPYQKGVFDKSKNTPECMLNMQSKWEENIGKVIENL